jgi:hypothetical protein
VGRTQFDPCPRIPTAHVPRGTCTVRPLPHLKPHRSCPTWDVHGSTPPWDVHGSTPASRESPPLMPHVGRAQFDPCFTRNPTAVAPRGTCTVRPCLTRNPTADAPRGTCTVRPLPHANPHRSCPTWDVHGSTPTSRESPPLMPHVGRARFDPCLTRIPTAEAHMGRGDFDCCLTRNPTAEGPRRTSPFRPLFHVKHDR